MPGFGLGTFGAGTFGIGADNGFATPALVGSPSSGLPVSLRCFCSFDADTADVPLLNGADSTFETANNWVGGTGTTYQVAPSAVAYAGLSVGLLQRTSTTGTASATWSSGTGTVTPNRWYMGLIYIRPGWLGAQARPTQGVLTFKTSGGTVLSTVTVTTAEVVGRWLPVCVVGLAPASVSKVDFTVSVLNAPVAEQHRIDCATVDRLGTELTPRLVEAPWRRGRNDELGTVNASTCTVTLRNVDGYLTPDATGVPAPYLGNIDDGRRVVLIRDVNGVLYPEWAGETEAWEQSIHSNGRWSEVEVQCTDAFAAFGAPVEPPLPAEIMLDVPDAYLRLDEAEGATSAGSTAGDGRSAPILTSKYGSGASAFGSDNMLPKVDTGRATDDGQGWLSLNPSSAVPGAGNVLDLSQFPSAFPTGPDGWTVEIWARMPTTVPTETRILYRTAVSYGGYEYLSGFQLEMYTDGKIRVVTPAGVAISTPASWVYTAGFTVPIILTYDPSIGTWGRVGLRISYSLISLTATLGADPFSAGTPDRAWLGGYYQSYLRTMQYAWRTPVAHVAFWSRVLSSDRTDAHAVVGQLGGYGGETEGNRIGGIADLIGWNTCWTRIDRGMTVLMARSWSKTTALALIQNIAKQASAVVYIDAAGKLVMRNRHYRINRPAVATFRAADGTAISAKEFRPRKDPTYVENSVRVKRTLGATSTARDGASIRRHRERPADDIELSILSEEEVTAYAQWRLATRKDNRARVASLVLQPGVRPALWPIVMTLEIGDRVSVQGLPGLAPSTTMDCFVESIAVSGTSSKDAEFTLGLSPWREDLHQMAELYEPNEPGDIAVSTLGNAKCKLGWY